MNFKNIVWFIKIIIINMIIIIITVTLIIIIIIIIVIIIMIIIIIINISSYYYFHGALGSIWQVLEVRLDVAGRVHGWVGFMAGLQIEQSFGVLLLTGLTVGSSSLHVQLRCQLWLLFLQIENIAAEVLEVCSSITVSLFFKLKL